MSAKIHYYKFLDKWKDKVNMDDPKDPPRFVRLAEFIYKMEVRLELEKTNPRYQNQHFYGKRG